MTRLHHQSKTKTRKLSNKSLFGTLQRPRVIISKSNRYLTVQAVDDYNQHTLAYLCTRSMAIEQEKNSHSLPNNLKSEKIAEELGVQFAKILTEREIKNIIFDRNDYVYHGKIKAFCNKMRELGINF